ncbi:unknown [Bacteroides sp. CAG:1060]|nr:unknown [Bacteroides sp. CAG:1060]
MIESEDTQSFGAMVSSIVNVLSSAICASFKLFHVIEKSADRIVKRLFKSACEFLL